MSPQLRSAIAILKDLVGFDSTSRNSNLPLIDYIAGYLSDLGLSPRKIHSDDGAKANLYVTIGPESSGGTVLSGHSDVVPVDGQNWTSNPFNLTERQGRLYGRGTADMKGFIACCLAITPRFIERDLANPIHLAFSYDEEVGCLGVGRMIDLILSDLPHPAAVIIGEPTSMEIINAHKGICAMSTTFRGREAHSSRPHDGVNSIEAAAMLVSYLYKLCDELSKTDRDNRFDPPYTTFNAGIISGGDAVNIIARECLLNWEFRPIPGSDPDAIAARVEDWVHTVILPHMKNTGQECFINTERNVLVPPFDSPASAAEAIARKASGLNSAGAVAFVTEASLFSRAGIPAVICGPGDIAQAHQPDEFISIEQLASCLGFLERTASAAE
ncbi:MAG: acetylornithine deacetylase [Pseudomonadota bacterium]|nr:acetylornithine deacetylase [Pseudomonadota bacterium]